MILQKYGLDSFFINQLSKDQHEKSLAKIVSANKKGFHAITEFGEVNCIIKGSMIHHKVSNDGLLPKVGDFVILDIKNMQPSSSVYFIKSILQRKNSLKRKVAGKKIEDQVIVTNVDYALITIPCDDQFNLKRLQRFVIACKDSKIIPIVILTKSDLADSLLDKIYGEVESIFPDVKIFATNFLDQLTILPIVELLKDNKVGVFIGSSGAGKSTLTNMIIGSNVQKISDVSDEKDKGKHTTTHREIFLLPTGGAIIDNPGVKEFGLWLNNEDSINYGFEDILELARKCKFNNCTHQNEPGCKIQEAIKNNIIDAHRVEELFKLKAEEDMQALRKSDHEKRKGEKKFNKMYETAKKSKYGNRYED
jgi:ribosome biogenesis GTPase